MPYIEGLPRIDRYFPHCRWAAVEAVCGLLHGTDNFGKAYGSHTLRYRPGGPVLMRQQNGVDLDMDLHRANFTEGELDAKIGDIFGIEAAVRALKDWDTYRDDCLGKLARQMPAIIDFDLLFIKERRHYGRLSAAHTIIVRGHDPERRCYFAAEQVLGDITIDERDFRGCFDYKMSTRGYQPVIDVHSTGKPERALGREEVLAQIHANVANLASSDPLLGLNALRRFQADLALALQAGQLGREPFAIPGLWVFSHERHIVRKWLAAVRPLCRAAHHPCIDALTEILSRLFVDWRNIDFLLEKSLMSGNAAPLATIPKALSGILEGEVMALENWRRLGLALEEQSLSAPAHHASVPNL